MKVLLRYLSSFDVDQLVPLAEKIDPTWDEEDFLAAFDGSHTGVVAECKERLLGWLILDIVKPGKLRLLTAGVVPKYRRRRLATTMFNHALVINRMEQGNPARKIQAIPREDNLPAHLWLKSLGFKAKGMAYQYYPEPIPDGIKFILEVG